MCGRYRGRVPRSEIIATGLVARLPPDSAVAVVRRGRCTVVGVEPAEVVTAWGADGVRVLDQLAPGFWVGWCSFELGHAVERVIPRGASLDVASLPDLAFARFDATAVVDERGRVRVQGSGPGRALLERAASTGAPPNGAPPSGRLEATRWVSSLDRDSYRARVETILALLRAGECYQVNLTRRLTCDRALDPAALHAALARSHPAPHTALVRLPMLGAGTALVSASPECFLRVRGRDVETRPIKGTAATRAALQSSAKDHAENVMIVDLARNDLGRVCEAGSIDVPALCTIEAHPGLHHLVSTVRGRLRDGVGWGALVGATFPPASVTGAPKPRVLQVIEDLEPVRRGAYCGAVGWIDTSSTARGPGRVEADLAVAIRTFTVLGTAVDGCTHFGVGGGIVADSHPEAEWEETELKAARLLQLAGAGAAALVPS